MLLHIDGEVVEIRPSEYFESKTLVNSRYLELVSEPKKRGRPIKKANKLDKSIEETHGTSSGT